MTAARYFALVVGLLYIVVGILGFIPRLHTPWTADSPPLLVENGYGYLLGVLPKNLVLNIVQLALGVWGVASYSTLRGARIFAAGFALVAGFMAVAGLTPALGTLFGLLPLFGPNVLVHLLPALGAAGIAFVTRDIRVARQPPPARHAAPLTGVASAATIAGRPIHPALTPFPIAFLTGTLASDLAYWWTTLPWYNTYGHFLAGLSLWMLAAGVVTGVLAAIVGLIDFAMVGSAREHRAGWVHALGNGGVLALAVINLLSRSGDPVAGILPWGLVLSTVTALLLAVTSWAGSDLVRQHLIGVTGPRQPSRTYSLPAWGRNRGAAHRARGREKAPRRGSSFPQFGRGGY